MLSPRRREKKIKVWVGIDLNCRLISRNIVLPRRVRRLQLRYFFISGTQKSYSGSIPWAQMTIEFAFLLRRVVSAWRDEENINSKDRRLVYQQELRDGQRWLPTRDPTGTSQWWDLLHVLYCNECVINRRAGRVLWEKEQSDFCVQTANFSLLIHSSLQTSVFESERKRGVECTFPEKYLKLRGTSQAKSGSKWLPEIKRKRGRERIFVQITLLCERLSNVWDVLASQLECKDFHSLSPSSDCLSMKVGEANKELIWEKI